VAFGGNALGDKREDKGAPSVRGRRLIFAVWAIGAALLLIEGVLRLKTQAINGGSRLNGVDLLPLSLVTESRRRALSEDHPYLVADVHCGWTIRPHGRTEDGLYAANGHGLRSAPRDVPKERAGGVRRVLVVGDSIAHGDELPWGETWCARLQEGLGDGHEIWCGAVPGYGTDQALLRLERLLPVIGPEVVILGVYRQNLLRNLTFFRSLQHPRTQIPWSKPRFVLQDGELVLANYPALPPDAVAATLAAYEGTELARDDRFWEPELYTDDARYRSRLWRYVISRERLHGFYDRSSAMLHPGGPAITLGVALVQKFRRDMAALGRTPLILILPDDIDVRGWRAGAPPIQPFLDALAAAAIPFVETGQPLAASLSEGETAGALFVGGAGHPNARATRVIADRLLPVLR